MNENDNFTNEVPMEIAKKLNIPYSAMLEIITKCNFNCVHCYIPEHTKIMSTIIIYNLIDQLKELGVFEVTFTGGEIFLHKDILDIISYTRSKGIRVTLFSNISTINEKIVQKLSQMYITEISTTLFSMNEEINNHITQNGKSFELVMKNMMLIKKYGIPLEVKVPIMTDNINCYEEIKTFCNDNGFKFSYTTAITAQTNGNQETAKYRIRSEEVRKVVHELENDFIVRQRTDDVLCPAVLNSLHIDVDGNVYPCISFPWNYGNVYNSSLSDIWYNSDNRRLLKEYKKRDLIQCEDCNVKEYCVRCPGLALTEDGNLLGCSSIDKALARARMWCEFSCEDLYRK